jgi:hypothetical protein
MTIRMDPHDGTGSYKRLLGAAVGAAALAGMALFSVTHSGPVSAPGGITADSGAETKFPAYSSPAVRPMNMGATTTTQPTDEPTALATAKATPAIKAG